MNVQQFQPIIVTVIFLAFFYFLLIRPQKKKEAEINEMRKNLRVGDEIITIGGIRGKIVKIKDEYVTIEVGTAKTKLELTKWAVGSVIKKNESKSKKDEDSKKEDDIKKEDNSRKESLEKEENKIVEDNAKQEENLTEENNDDLSNPS